MKTNPVYRRETMVSVRSFRLALVLMLFNGILALVALLNMYSTLAQVRLTAEIQYTSFLDLYLFMAVLEFVMLVLIMPAITAGSISGERERRTLDLMLTTRLTPTDIVMGKLAAALSTMGLLVISSFPMLVIVFVYGGITIGDIARLLVCYAAAALFAGSVGMACSSLFKRTTVATVAAYAALGVIVIGTYGANQFARYISGMRIDSYMVSAGGDAVQAGSGGALYLLLLNPAATFWMTITELTGGERVWANAAYWFGSGSYSGIKEIWTAVSVAVQVLAAAFLIWISVRMISVKGAAANEGKKKIWLRAGGKNSRMKP